MAEVNTYKFDNIPVGGLYRPGYIGEGEPGVLESDAQWTVYKFSYDVMPDGEVVVTQIQERTGVSWTDRASASWA